MDLYNAWANFNFVTASLVLLAYFVLDAMYAYYTVMLTERRAVSAATVGALMHFIIAFGVLSFVHNLLYIIPIAIGSWLGTYTMVRYEQSISHLRKKAI